MGSVAQDQQRQHGRGLQRLAAARVYPSIRYPAAWPRDALGTLPQGEGRSTPARASRSGLNRWGDYSAMTVDPTDDCTFWYTKEYNSSGGWNWSTRIGSFKFAGCSSGPAPTADQYARVGADQHADPPPTNTPTSRSHEHADPHTRVPPTNTPIPADQYAGARRLRRSADERRVRKGPAAPWVQTSSGGYNLVDTTRPHTGSYSAYLAGYNNGTDTIYQTVTIPSNATSATLSYWWYMSTRSGQHALRLPVRARAQLERWELATLQTITNASAKGVWTKSTYNLLAYKGQTVRVYFKGTTDVSLTTSFFVDDVSLNICH